MATTTTSTLQSYYKWNDAEFSWEAQQCYNRIDSFGIYTHSQQSTEEANLLDGNAQTIQKTSKDTVGIVDSNNRAMRHISFDAVSVGETYWDNIGYIMNFLESFGVNDNEANHISKNKIEPLHFDESQRRNLLKSLAETLQIDEDTVRKIEFVREVAEAITCLESFLPVFHKNNLEELAVSESDTKQLSHVTQEALNLNDIYNHIGRVKRMFSEALSARESQNASVRKNEEEPLQIYEAFLKACEGTLADIGIYEGDISLDDFLSIIKQPSGYEPFIPYVTGEYEYEKALVRLLITAGSVGSQPAVYDATVNVDIDDTIDRGSVSITDTSGPTKVYFNKHYYTKPEVTVTLQSGNTADGDITPNVERIDKDDDGYYFTIELLKADGTRTSGRVSWSSIGY